MTTPPDDKPLDFVIVGQGIAGTTLTWQLRWRGLRGLTIDADDGVSASKVAAGLMNPVTGKRLVPAWNLKECWPAAEKFYRQVELETNSRFFTQSGQVRLFDSQKSNDDFQKRHRNELPVEVRQPQPPVDDNFFNAPYGGFELPTARRLDVPKYLQVSRDVFEADNCFRILAIDSDSDLRLTESGVFLYRLGIRTRRIIFCQGMGVARNSWFNNVGTEPARGEILTLRIDGLTETRIINQGVWLTPCGDGLFMAGSTYDLNNLDAGPTTIGRDEICDRLANFLKLPVEIVNHSSGVRPIVSGRQPVIGWHPEHPQIGIFNGLGSKGSLQAPYVANQLVEQIVNGTPIASELDVQKRFPGKPKDQHKPRPLRLTQQAHQIVWSVVQPGDCVVDATAGNGHDTCFLAKLTGDEGKVYAFDVQAVAVERTTERLAKESLENTIVMQRDHAELKEAIPSHQHGQIAAIMFNLGYLPGGDHSVITRTPSSIQAIQASLTLIRPGGVITVLAYPGHSGGDDETANVQRMINELPAEEFDVSTRQSATTNETAPLLFVIVRR